MEILGFISEFIFLAMAIYLYLFSIGKIDPPNSNRKEAAQNFRQKNGTLLKILSLLLMAMMAFNILLHIKTVFFV